jgi:2-(1,2-epoxy-1,2-dihydrophenyl)acetyl-CoA isomerase
MGSSFLLPRQVGLHRAKEMTMSGRRIDAEEARRLGLAAAITEPDELAGAVRRQAEQLASRSMTAMALTKRLMNQSQENCLMSMLESEAMAQGLAVTDPEHRLAVDEFQRRRANRVRDNRPAVPGGTA